MIREAAEFHIEGMLEHGDPLPTEQMSVEQAMVYHSEPLTEKEIENYAQYGDWPTTLSVTFKEIEVDVPAAPPVTTGRFAG